MRRPRPSYLRSQILFPLGTAWTVDSAAATAHYSGTEIISSSCGRQPRSTSIPWWRFIWPPGKANDARTTLALSEAASMARRRVAGPGGASTQWSRVRFCTTAWGGNGELAAAEPCQRDRAGAVVPHLDLARADRSRVPHRASGPFCRGPSTRLAETTPRRQATDCSLGKEARHCVPVWPRT